MQFSQVKGTGNSTWKVVKFHYIQWFGLFSLFCIIYCYFFQDDDGEDLDFDPLELRAKRQMALANAMVQPILSSSSVSGEKLNRGSEVIYPFVFDSFAKAKMAPGTLS